MRRSRGARAGAGALALLLAVGVGLARAQDGTAETPPDVGSSGADAPASAPRGGDARPDVPDATAADAPALVDGADPERFVEIVRDAGYRAVLETDGAGDPMVVSRMAGLNTTLVFERCTERAACRLVRFTTRFIQDDPPSLEAINEWNRTKLLGKAYLDGEGAAMLIYEVNVENGVAVDNFRSSIDWWDLLLNEFKVHIDF